MLNSFKFMVILSVVFIFLTAGVYCSALAEQPGKSSEKTKEYVVDLKNKICPVMGDTAKEELYVIYENKVYHLCCQTCIDEFKNNPGKYAAKTVPAPIAQQAKYEAASDGKCPVMGGAVNKNIYAIKDGKVYYFCCPSCVETFKDKNAASKK
ncbi:MAG: TRASH domain-containing protein [Candidatus Wallbacteria bacterium]